MLRKTHIHEIYMIYHIFLWKITSVFRSERSKSKYESLPHFVPHAYEIWSRRGADEEKQNGTETHNNLISFNLKFTSLSIKFYLFHKLFKGVYSSSYFTPSEQDFMASCWDAIFALPDSKQSFTHRSLFILMGDVIWSKSDRILFAFVATLLIIGM